MVSIRDRTLDYLDMMVPFEIAAQSRMHPEQRIARAQADYMAVLDCTGTGKQQYTGFASLMYGGPTYEAERRIMVVALAAAAYQPGGVTWMGRHWCTNHTACLDAAREASAMPSFLDRNPDPDDKPAGSVFRGRSVAEVHLPDVA